jgi:hypothetical protein
MGVRFSENYRLKQNPVYCKIPGSSCIGLGASVTSPSPDVNELNNEAEEEPDDMVVLHQTTTESKCDTPNFKKAKKLKLSAETEETSKLTTGELQHLLLLEQIKLTRLQAQREQTVIEELNQRTQQQKQMESDKIVVEEGDVLKEFLFLK